MIAARLDGTCSPSAPSPSAEHNEIVAMPHGLDVQKCGVEDDGDDADEDELRDRIYRSRRRACEVRQHKGEGRHRDQHMR